MKSTKCHDWLDLEHDLSTSKDIIALRCARQSRPMDFAAYLEFLANFPPPPQSTLRARKGPGGRKCFELR